MAFEIIHGDALEVLKGMEANSVDAVVTDPPYGLAFMGKKWDYDVPATELWAECLRVLKPGGHLLAFAGTRTQHRMAVRIEDAGFEIRDMIAWVYGSGFPKSMDVSKAIDKAAGATREVVGTLTDNHPRYASPRKAIHEGGTATDEPPPLTAPATEAARQWQGWGTALKPSTEPLTFARKPLDWRGLCLSLAQYITEETCQYSAGVKDAGPSSASSPSEFAVDPSAFALWSAVEKCNTPGDLFALMDTLPSGLAIPTSLSTVFSWLRTLDGLLKHESTFTTETASSLITDLRTLNSLLSRNTQGTIIAELTEANGRGSSAELVACIFSACDASLKSTLARSVHASAIAQAQENYLDAGASPSMEPITVARKPLVGTVAENVLEHGTGALNVDGCRVGNEAMPATSRGVSRLGTFEGADGNITPERTGRWPANLILSYPEDEYELKENTSKDALRELYLWLHENA